MDGEHTSCESQDVLATLTHPHVEFISSREPWKREFNCGAVPVDVLVEDEFHYSESSSNSNSLPSLREEYADFAQLGSTSFPIALVDNSRGIEFLFGRLFKILRRLSCSPSITNMKEFLQVLGVIEFVGSEICLNETNAVNYLEMYSRFLLKVGILSKSVAVLPASSISQAIPFHAALFAWGFACRLFEAKSSVPPDDRYRLTTNDAFVVFLDGLAVSKQNIGCAIPCSCVHSVLLDLYKTLSSKLLECCFRIVQCLISGECPYSSSELGGLRTTPINFLAFFSDVVSHLIDIRAIPSSEIMARFILMVGMGDLICDTTLLPICKILLLFMNKYNLKGLVKIRKSASKFVTKILQMFEVTELPVLEKLSRGDAFRWAEYATNGFRYCGGDEPLLIEFLLRLLSDEQLSSCRSIVINRYGNSKLLMKGYVLSSILSVLLALVAGVHDGEELTTKFCHWLVESVGRCDEDQCHVLFNAFDALAIISSNVVLNKMNIGLALANAVNALPLPEMSRVFGKRYLVMVRSYTKQLCDVDVNRFLISASTSELLGFYHILAEVESEIPGSIWDKAASLLVTASPNDPRLQAFVVNQLVLGIQARSPHSSTRFKYVLEKLSCAHPDADFLFMFCNGILSRLQGQFPHIITQLVPLWIFAVLAYSSSREMDTKRFTSLIWDHISQSLSSIAPNVCLELSLGNPELFVVKFFTVLGSSTSSAEIVRRTVSDSVPLYLAQQIANLLKNNDVELEERIVRVCGEMFTYVGSTMLAIAETEAQRIGLNRTSFVVLVQALVTKLVKGSMESIFLLQVVPMYISALVKLPYRMFIYSRIKDLLLKFTDESAVAFRIAEELTSSHGLACHSQLIKESDPRIKKYFIATNRSDPKFFQCI